MRVRLALVPLAVAATLLAGCATNTPGATATPTPTVAGNGVAALTATEIMTKTQTALKNAKSFHIKGTMTESGQATKIDMSISDKDFAGTIETQGVALDLVLIGTDIYIKAPDSFWASQIPANLQSALAGLKGKYVKVDATKPEFASFKALFPVDDIVKTSGTVTKGETKTIGGKSAIGIINDAVKSVLYVATEGEPYPLRMEPTAASPTAASPSASASASTSTNAGASTSASTSTNASTSAGASTGGIDFSEFGTATVKAPDAANVFDLKTITG